jgi:hypothetical protein
MKKQNKKQNEKPNEKSNEKPKGTLKKHQSQRFV